MGQVTEYLRLRCRAGKVLSHVEPFEYSSKPAGLSSSAATVQFIENCITPWFDFALYCFAGDLKRVQQGFDLEKVLTMISKERHDGIEAAVMCDGGNEILGTSCEWKTRALIGKHVVVWGQCGG